MHQQPKPEAENYSDLISNTTNGIIKVPKFQRDFVWSIDKTARLLDSIIKGYPVGTFILWETSERMNEVKNIGNLKLKDAPKGNKVRYVLDGQQRITSLYAAFLGAKIPKTGGKKETDYKEIYIDLKKDINNNSEQVITAEKPDGDYVTLHEVLNHNKDNNFKVLLKKFPDDIEKILEYNQIFEKYNFSIVLLKQNDIDSAIEVFTRINTGGQTLTLFEIMAAKTYDEEKKFDMQEKWKGFINKLQDVNYETITSSTILHILGLLLDKNNECNSKAILKLNKQDIIDNWDKCISALEDSIEYFKNVYLIPVSQILPFDSLLTTFSYFFLKNGGGPTGTQKQYLQEFFWRMALSYRYSSGAEGKLTQDVARMGKILNDERPKYDGIKVDATPEDLIQTNFRAGNSFCKGIICLLASQEPKDFDGSGKKVVLDNAWLKIATSKNYHHFFPRAFLEKQKIANENSMMNITIISAGLNKGEIRAKAPSEYIGKFIKEHDEKTIKRALKKHFIDIKDGIDNDDYDTFLQKRAETISKEIKKRMEIE